jgi:hypothetical protein
MKRIFLAAASVSLLAIGAPSAASAHRAKHHRAACTSRTHHRHHAKCARSRVLRFGATASASAGASTDTSASPPSPTSETAGTVKSFNEGVLTITLNDGTEVSGKVTEDTELECRSATPPAGGDDEQGDDGGGGHDSALALSDRGSAPSSGDDGGDDEQGDEDGGAASCTTAALMPGAVVREAELHVGSGGAVWTKVELLV